MIKAKVLLLPDDGDGVQKISVLSQRIDEYAQGERFTGMLAAVCVDYGNVREFRKVLKEISLAEYVEHIEDIVNQTPRGFRWLNYRKI